MTDAAAGKHARAIRVSATRLIVAQMIDVATFVAFFVLVTDSVHVERNPLIAAMFAMGGFSLVGLVKIGAASMVAYRSVNQPLARPRLVIILMAAATASGIVGAGFNTASLIDSLVMVAG